MMNAVGQDVDPAHADEVDRQCLEQGDDERADDRALDVAQAGEDDDVPREVERLDADRRVRRE